ncbi:MAG: type IV pilus modification PilV family protein [Candidatus Rifleibacteriota bacterium]
MKIRRRAFSLLEIVIAMAFLSIAILSVLWMNRSSNQGSMDAYYEFLAFSLAREPIEIFRGFGYDCLKDIVNGNTSPPSHYPVGSFIDIDFDAMSDMQYPAEARLFQRQIELTSISSGGLNGIKIKVTVAARGQSKVDVWMSRKAVTLESLVMERPK